MKNVVIVGAGIAGLSTALDLALRGFKCCILDKGTVGSGTTTKCAGMLHSGARYAVSSPEIAKLCNSESETLKHIAPFAVDGSKGLFIIPENHNVEYVSSFVKNCQRSGIVIKKISKRDCWNLEPQLNHKIIGGFETPDAIINPFLLVESYKEELANLGVGIREFTSLTNARYTKGEWVLYSKNNKNQNTNELITDIVINAAGSWSEDIAGKLGLKLNLVYIQGTMFRLKRAICKRVVSICMPNTTGDVIIKSGNTSLVGSTWHELDSNNLTSVTKKDKKDIVKISSQIFPYITLDKINGHFSGIRTHLKENTGSKGKFAVDRNYAVIDHEINDKIPNVYTVLSGKLTFGRLVAESVVNKICEKLNMDVACRTSKYILKQPKNSLKTELSNFFLKN